MTNVIPCERIITRLSDHYECAARLWLPDAPRAAVLYLHGIQSHGGWFEASAAHLAGQGVAVLMPDRRGSGRNEVERGHAPSARRLLHDCADHLDELHVRCGFNAFHCVGVSWGAKLALSLRRFVPERVSGITLVAPGLFPKVDIPGAAKMRVALSALTGGGRTRFDIPLNDPAMFTANGERQRFIAADPLKLTQVTSSFLLASRRLDRYAKGVAGDRQGCPLTVLLAGQDRIISNEETKAFVRRLSWPGRKIIEYPQAHHTLEFEDDPAACFAELADSVAGCDSRAS
jgi:alpha-beta hydrolase superfamily lysophospholipase